MKKIVLRPSAAERWMNCPASINYTDSKTTVYSTEGTKQHEVAAKVLQNFTTLSFEDATKKNKFDAPNDNTSLYIKTVMEDCKATKNSRLHVEEKISWESFGIILEGTPDAVIETEKGISVYDLKNGYQEVSTQENYQLACYAFLASVHYKKPIIGAFIVQDSDVKPIVNLNLNLLRSALIHLEDIVLEKLFSYYSPGDWCQFCPHRMDCDTYRKSVSPFAAALPQLKDADPTTLGHLFALSKFLKSYLAEVEEKVKDDIVKNGKDIPGFKAVEGRGMRAWSKPEVEVIETLKVNGLTEEQYLHPKYLKSYTEIEKLNSEAKKLVSELVQVRKGITIVPTSDPRPAIGPIPEFDQLPLQGDSNG